MKTKLCTQIFRMLILAMLMAMAALPARAYDFEVDGLCYNINSDGTSVTLTSQNSSSPHYSNLSGDLLIPESVTDNGNAYQVTTIDDFAFNGCSGLTSVTIPNSVTYIGTCAFANCTNLAIVAVPESLASIGSQVFDFTPWYDNQPDGIVYLGSMVYRYKGAMPSVTSIVINDGTLGVACDAFSNCSGLTSVTIPNSVTFIGTSAFSGCTGLTNVTIPESVTKIGYAFFECSNLTTVTLKSDSVVSKNYSDSYNNIKRIFGDQVGEYIIGDGVKSIGDFAFSGCEMLNLVTLPNTLTEIGNKAFGGCVGLTSITIPNSVKIIGNEAFTHCNNLRSVNMSRTVTHIGYNSFYDCSSLMKITLPNSLTSIGAYAFGSCTALAELRSRIKDVNSVNYDGGVNIFQNVPVLTCKLYVPVGTKSSYITHNLWRVFYNIIEEGDVNIDGTLTATDVTCLYNYLLNNDSSGLVNGDVNNDGHITSADVTAVYNLLLGDQ